jgi:hypothetical protein
MLGWARPARPRSHIIPCRVLHTLSHSRRRFAPPPLKVAPACRASQRCSHFMASIHAHVCGRARQAHPCALSPHMGGPAHRPPCAPMARVVRTCERLGRSQSPACQSCIVNSHGYTRAGGLARRARASHHPLWGALHDDRPARPRFASLISASSPAEHLRRCQHSCRASVRMRAPRVQRVSRAVRVRVRGRGLSRSFFSCPKASCWH